MAPVIEPLTSTDESPTEIPMPDSIFRTEPEPVLQPPEPSEMESESAIADDDSPVIVDDQADLNQQSAKRDRKTLTIVLSLAIAMVGIVAVALLVIFL